MYNNKLNGRLKHDHEVVLGEAGWLKGSAFDIDSHQAVNQRLEVFECGMIPLRHTIIN